MKAIVFDQFGPPEVLRLVDLPVPEPGDGQLRLRVHAVSVNQALDVGLRQGVAGVPVKLPNTPGIDPSGVVDAVGPGVSGWSVGDTVAASVPPTQGGGYAEFALVAAAAARRVPEGLDFPRATVVNRHFPTAYSLMRTANVQSGETVLVLGAAGALSTCLLQLTKEAGATIIAGAGADARVQAALDLGGDMGVNYRRDNLRDRVQELTGGKGVNVVFDNVGDPAMFAAAVSVMQPGGRLVTVGTHGGDGILPLDGRVLYRNRLSILSGMLGGTKPTDAVEAMTKVRDGVFRVLIDRILPLEEAVQAHRLVEDNLVTGKVILTPTA